IAYANDPERLFDRFWHQVDRTYVNRKLAPARGKLTFANLSGAAVLAFRILWYLVIRSDYRRPFLRAARHAFKRRQYDAMFGIAFIGYHLIEFTREALRGEQNASIYSQARKDVEPAAGDELTPIRKSA
ncbi:MAG: hopanoid methylase, partial [Rhodospirillaceae bacterium]|nr:hopanoid methylase [Rhodospirillaceae bacterium]